ncbi:IS630 family transposase [Glycomyces sp. NPDC021274]|uniref:DDE endonuclease n=1 Tax=Streptomyces noursei TaxID=1971 RepID=A0A2N8PCP8_STRNR|nr:DDE endonuclease [Streptomyces noursei]
MVLDPDDRCVLLERVRAHTAPQRVVRRARIVLLAAGGCSAWRIAEIVRVDVSTVVRWRDRYAQEGLAGLEDRPRSGRPPMYGPEVRLRIVATATSTPPRPYGGWSHRLIAAHLADTGISASQAGRILAALQVKPHRVRGWLTRPADPQFFSKAAEVCDLYRTCPPRSVVLSVDEKTAMAARSRKHPDRPPGPGRVRWREFEYVRHGTVSVTAALDVHTGQVVVEELPRNDSAHFIRFLARLERCIPTDLTIHLVLDNGSSHTSKATRAWLAKHPRIVAHYTPKHASWLNQVEIFFSLLARAVLRHGDFSSRADLLEKVTDFAIAHNETARPFSWNYKGRPRQTEDESAVAAKEPCHAR